MKRTKGRIKLVCVAAFAMCALVFVLMADDSDVTPRADAFSDGPPAGFTGAPGEQTCTACHVGPDEGGTFTITPPANYTPGQTYQITVRHVNADQSRKRWGFQLTALAGTAMAGTLTPLPGGITQVVGGVGRDYIEHTAVGTFANQLGGAQWVFDWTAPSTNVGEITFYAAGNQANFDGSASGDRILTAVASTQPPVTPTAESPFDFDGDHKTDFGIYRPGPSEWWINRSSNAQTFALQFGGNGDVPVAGDYTGDGKADVANWRPTDGVWYILRSEDFSFFAFPFGAQGDVPVPADFDGDNKTDPAIFRPASSLWFISQSVGGGTQIVQFGLPIDKPLPADYDGDGKADVAVRRPTGGNSEWWINRSTAGSLALVFGADTDLGVPGDYTGDGKIDIAFWRPSTGVWFVLRSEDLSFFAVPFGTTGDVPSPGDYDADGKWDRAVFRPADANWFIDRSTAGIQIVQFGATGDVPIPNTVVR